MGERRRTRRLSRAALQLTEGLFSHAVDLALWSVAYFAHLSVTRSMSQLYRTEMAADRFLSQVNYEVIKNALNAARKKGWLVTKNRHALPEITREGKRRLASLIPHYDDTRMWDSRMHLITYDIPEKRRRDRGLLREYLQRIGCGRLQDSVWMTPYNPIDTLRSFIEEKQLGGTVIVSDIGKDGSIGEEDVQLMVVRTYGLEPLNDRYEEWLADVGEHGVDHWAVVRYLSILADDPQLPFPLLPSWWKGEKAYLSVKNQLL
ncbi:CRISPR-associated endonuclease Cas2 [Candidatus Gottesmanbacteria bacterium]|nr:CRISPR-associated endonuclease Cas2 [Candidatus Gottesmanbacteria bacterium]